MHLILSIAVFLQGKKLERMLEEKDGLFQNLGYTKGRLSSAFIETRKQQLKLISHTYLAANMLVIVEMILIFGVNKPGVHDCASLCAKPYTNSAAALLWVFSVIHLMPTHFFIYSFYIIPRRFYAVQAEDMKLEDTSNLNSPLLDENLKLVDSGRGDETKESKSSFIIGDEVEVFSGRLRGQSIGGADQRRQSMMMNMSL